MALDFNLLDHQRFVQDRGEQVTWHRMTLCPCGSSEIGIARATCPKCLGTGMRYGTGVEITAIITQISRQRAWLEAGFATPSDLVMSRGPYDTEEIGDWDIIELTGWGKGQATQGEVIKRGTGVSDTLQFPAMEALSCYSVDPSTLEISQNYALGDDFTFNGRLITWIGGVRPHPAAETLYSIKYTALYQWVVFAPPGDRFDRGQSLGDKVLLRMRQTALKQLEISNG